MDRQGSTGVTNFFNDYGKVGRPVRTEDAADSPTQPKPSSSKQPSTGAQKVKARTGRPPGIANGSRTHKEKATMHVNAALLDYYRDWSWEARCNLGELIERAMVAYKSRRDPRGDKKSPRT